MIKQRILTRLLSMPYETLGDSRIAHCRLNEFFMLISVLSVLLIGLVLGYRLQVTIGDFLLSPF